MTWIWTLGAIFADVNPWARALIPALLCAAIGAAIGFYLPPYAQKKLVEDKQSATTTVQNIGQVTMNSGPNFGIITNNQSGGTNPRFTDRMREPDFWDMRDGRGALGGAPQVIKIYEHANTLPIAVRWPRSDGTKATTLLGRPLFDWEKTFNPIYDPEQKLFYYPLVDVADQSTISKRLSAE